MPNLYQENKRPLKTSKLTALPVRSKFLKAIECMDEAVAAFYLFASSIKASSPQVSPGKKPAKVELISTGEDFAKVRNAKAVAEAVSKLEEIVQVVKLEYGQDRTKDLNRLKAAADTFKKKEKSLRIKRFNPIIPFQAAPNFSPFGLERKDDRASFPSF